MKSRAEMDLVAEYGTDWKVWVYYSALLVRYRIRVSA
jgi:hypothetical protein